MSFVWWGEGRRIATERGGRGQIQLLGMLLIAPVIFLAVVAVSFMFCFNLLCFSGDPALFLQKGECFILILGFFFFSFLSLGSLASDMRLLNDDGERERERMIA